MSQRLKGKMVFLEEPAEFRAITGEPDLPECTGECPPLPLSEVGELYRALIEHCSEGVVIFEGGRCLCCNRTFSVMMGRSDPGGEAPPERYRCRLIKEDGSTVAAEVSVCPIVHQGVRLSLGFVRGVTERKKGEKALSESEELYRQTLENSPDAIVLHDGERFIYLNPAALTLYAIEDAGSLMGRKVFDYIHGEDRRIVRERTERTGKTDIPLSLREIRIIRANGETIPADLTLGTIRYHGEQVFQILFRDITRRRAAEKALRESEERYRNIFENAMAGIFRSTGEGRYIDVNPALARIHGFADPEEMITGVPNIHSGLYVRPEDRLRCLGGLESEGFLRGFEVELYRKDHSTIWVSMNVRRVYGPEGVMRYDEGIVQDITERKAAEEALRQRERELEMESTLLGEANAALKVLLRHRDEDKGTLENTIMANVKDLVLPYIEKLKSGHPGDAQMAYLNILESNLKGILAPFLQKMAAVYARFTPTEVQVANLIGSGKTTKEIADLLNVSAGTVNSHRNRIRSKLGFRNKQINLRTYLMSL